MTSSKSKIMFGSDSHRPMEAASSSVSSSFSSSSSSSTGSIRDLRSASPNNLPTSSDALSLTFVDGIFEKVLTTFLGGSDGGGEDGIGGTASTAGPTPVGAVGPVVPTGVASFILRGARNGILYGTRIRLVDAIVKTLLYSDRALFSRASAERILEATYEHGSSLGLSVAINKLVLVVLAWLARRKAVACLRAAFFSQKQNPHANSSQIFRER